MKRVSMLAVTTRRVLLAAMICGSIAAGLPSLAQAAMKPCSPKRPAAAPISVTTNAVGTLQIHWENGATTPSREWILYSSEHQARQTYSNVPGLENGTARSAELTNLNPGELYTVVVAFEYRKGNCVEEAPEGNDLGSSKTGGPMHWWFSAENGKKLTRIPDGEVVTIKYYGPITLRTIKGTTSNIVSCGEIDADATVENPLGGGTGQVTILNFTASQCSQTGYCATTETPEIRIKTLPLAASTFEGPNGYNFEHLNIGFVVQCSGKAVANIVGPTLLPYISNGGYEVTSPAELDFGDGGYFGEHYGNTGDLELEGSGGSQIIQPEGYWPFIGYEKYANDVIVHYY